MTGRSRPHGLAVGLAVALALLLCGCDTLRQSPKVDLVDPEQLALSTSPADTVAPRPAPANGSLFDAQRYRAAFEERQARQIGDVVMIRIIESISASQSSSATVDRSGSVAASVTALPLVEDRWNNALAANAKNENKFSGKGANASNQTFSGLISTTVVAVKSNGHLVVHGEKQIGLNENVDVLRFSGTIDPRMIRPGNVVASTEVADVRIASTKRGAQGEVLSMGWLSRIFLSVLPF